MNAFRAALLLVLFAAPVMAQGRGQPPTSDTVIVRRTAAGFLVNFDDQPLRVVFSALAEASGLNIVQTNIPLRNTTLHMGTAVSRDQMLDVIKGLAASNNVTVIEGPSLVRLEGPAPSPTTTQQQLAAQQAAAQAAQQQLYIYRLKHASAVQLAPVLQGLFAGITRQPTAAQLAAQNPLAALIGLAGGGRAGRGGEEIAINVPTTAAPPTQGQPGRGGGRGNQQAQQQQQAALSASAADIRIQAEESSNSLLIRATAADYQLITQVLSGVDLRPLQVLIEVMIAEVTRTRDLNVGVTVNDVSNNPKTENGTTVRGSQQSLAGARDFILQLTGGRGGVNFDIALNALQQRGDVRVLSMPVIIAENNREAILNVGSSRPFVQVSQSALGGAGGVVETVQYIDVGTVLTITPTINPDGYVNLQVQQTANSATNEIQFNAPVINKREATTQVFIRDGQTTVIGGLADNVQSNNSSGIPGLSRIPGLGWLFGNKQRTRTASELFLFLTPHVIFTDTDVDKLREAVKANSELLQTVPIEARIKPRGDTITVKLPPPRPDTIRKPPAR
jgi:general secretion pathway protein D